MLCSLSFNVSSFYIFNSLSSTPTLVFLSSIQPDIYAYSYLIS